MSDQSDTSLKVWVDGKQFSLDDFTLGELELLEDELGGLDDISRMTTMKAAVRFVWIIKRRGNPALTLDEVKSWNLNVFDQPDAEDDAPPTPAAPKKAARSTRARSGATS